jgi:hypothetical protein
VSSDDEHEEDGGSSAASRLRPFRDHGIEYGSRLRIPPADFEPVSAAMAEATMRKAANDLTMVAMERIMADLRDQLARELGRVGLRSGDRINVTSMIDVVRERRTVHRGDVSSNTLVHAPPPGWPTAVFVDKARHLSPACPEHDNLAHLMNSSWLTAKLGAAFLNPTKAPDPAMMACIPAPTTAPPAATISWADVIGKLRTSGAEDSDAGSVLLHLQRIFGTAPDAAGKAQSWLVSYSGPCGGAPVQVLAGKIAGVPKELGAVRVIDHLRDCPSAP